MSTRGERRTTCEGMGGLVFLLTDKRVITVGKSRQSPLRRLRKKCRNTGGRWGWRGWKSFKQVFIAVFIAEFTLSFVLVMLTKDEIRVEVHVIIITGI
jgi:hypothetical protein